MAEKFSKGVNRIWYRAGKFAANKNVEIKFRKPDSTLIENISVPESEDEGVYCLDYDFNELGGWLGIFFEDGVKITSCVFHISPVPKNMFVTYISEVT